MEENRQKSNREVLYYERVYYLTAFPDVHSKFVRDNPNPDIWTDNLFKDYNTAITILDDYNKSMWKGYEMSLSDFIKYYACDLDWAKQLQYCKVAPPAKEKNRWYDLEESNRQKFISRYSCIESLPINYGKQKETDEGLIISLNVIYKNERVWLFMVESQNPDLKSKYHALIKKQDGSDEGRFECENMTQPQDNQLSPD